MNKLKPQVRLNVAAAAKYLGYNVQALNRWRHQKTGPVYYKPIGSIFYLKSDLDDFLLKSKIEPTK